MGTRLQLQTLLETTLGSRNVYFQPPSTQQMKYPCIVYSRTNIEVIKANNNPYLVQKQYTIMVIDSNPDSLIPEKVAVLPKCAFVSHYTKDNLYHDVYKIYY